LAIIAAGEIREDLSGNTSIDKDRAIALSEPFMRKDDARRAQFAARRMALQVP